MVAVAALVKWGLTCVFNVEGVTIDRVNTPCPFLAVVAAIATMRFAGEADDDVAVVHQRVDSVSGYLAGHAVNLRVSILKAGER
jgi:hypothetical protein